MITKPRQEKCSRELGLRETDPSLVPSLASYGPLKKTDIRAALWCPLESKLLVLCRVGPRPSPRGEKSLMIAQLKKLFIAKF